MSISRPLPATPDDAACPELAQRRQLSLATTRTATRARRRVPPSRGGRVRHDGVGRGGIRRPNRSRELRRLIEPPRLRPGFPLPPRAPHRPLGLPILASECGREATASRTCPRPLVPLRGFNGPSGPRAGDGRRRSPRPRTLSGVTRGPASNGGRSVPADGQANLGNPARRGPNASGQKETIRGPD